MEKIKKLQSKVGSIVRKAFRNKHDIRRLANDNFTILSSNCTGGIMYHDLNKKFMSPTVNLYINPGDFLKFLKNLDYYLKQEVVFTDECNRTYPVGKLDDIYLFFMHYKSETEASEKWNERKTRINMDNLFVLMTDRDGCTYDDLAEFDKLTYKNKICFTSKEYPEFKSTVYVKEYKGQESVGMLSDIKSIFGKRMYQADGFDYIKWLNSGQGKS